MCICVYTYIYVYIYIYICIHAISLPMICHITPYHITLSYDICICVYEYMRIHMYIYIYIHICTRNLATWRSSRETARTFVLETSFEYDYVKHIFDHSYLRMCLDSCNYFRNQVSHMTTLAISLFTLFTIKFCI